MLQQLALAAALLLLHCVGLIFVDPYGSSWMPYSIVPVGTGIVAGVVLRWPLMPVLVVASSTFYYRRGEMLTDDPLLGIGVILNVVLLGLGLGAGAAARLLVQFAMTWRASRAPSA